MICSHAYFSFRFTTTVLISLHNRKNVIKRIFNITSYSRRLNTFSEQEINVNKHYEQKKNAFSMFGKISHTSLEMIIIFLRILHLLKEIVFVMRLGRRRRNGAMFIFGMRNTPWIIDLLTYADSIDFMKNIVFASLARDVYE